MRNVHVGWKNILLQVFHFSLTTVGRAACTNIYIYIYHTHYNTHENLGLYLRANIRGNLASSFKYYLSKVIILHSPPLTTANRGPYLQAPYKLSRERGGIKRDKHRDKLACFGKWDTVLTTIQLLNDLVLIDKVIFFLALRAHFCFLGFAPSLSLSPASVIILLPFRSLELLPAANVR